MSIDVGSLCFFNHPRESWVVATVTGKGVKGYSIRTADTARMCVGENFDSVSENNVAVCREDLLNDQPDDLLSLTVLHDAVLLRCLYLRYFRDIIYTNIGAIVVAINPFNFSIPWYQDAKMSDYLKEGPVIRECLPHSWSQAHNTYYEMITKRTNQCIIVSGESGAGKTEATKIVMKYLAHISCKHAKEEEKSESLRVGARLDACSPILECFGNARTVCNDNSSRFGKFMKVKFNKSGHLVGAETTRYLLEKSRIVTAGANERVYHSFYLLVRGSISKTLRLEGEAAYTILNAGGCMQNSEFNTAEDYKMVVDAMTQVGINADEVRSVWSCVAGILSLLNVIFEADGEGAKVKKVTEKYLEAAASFWRIDEAVLQKEMLTTTLVVKNSETIKLLSPVLAVDVRDALVKALYDGLFGWLVDKCNQLCNFSSEGNWIALLDIFGFENFKKNSFEQLCINLTNEMLQNHYNNYIFEKDIAECVAEGVDVTGLKCPDNSPCLRLILDNGGILALLDEECVLLGNGSDLGFLEKVNQAHGSGNPFFEKKKISRETFIIHHYAASVTYDVTGWLNKNRDTLKDKVRIMMRNSQDPIICNLLEPPLPSDMRTKRQTVGSFYKGQLLALMDVINSTNPHWIRCIKPHEVKKPLMFDGIQTMRQLESSGVLITVKIRKVGYPVRNVYDAFNKRYQIIIGSKAIGKEGRELAQLILAECDMNTKAMAQLGKTKVFMKADAFPIIERKRNNSLAKFSICLQKCGRGYLTRLFANRINNERKCKHLAVLLVREYRLYMKRSADLREAKLLWQKQQVLTFQTKSAALYEKCVEEKKEMFANVLQILHEEYRILKEHGKWLEMRAFEMQKERLHVIEDELVAREVIQKEAELSAKKLFLVFKRELQLFFEIVFGELDDVEWERRCHISVKEREERNNIWRFHKSRDIMRSLATIEKSAIMSRRILEAMEVIQRDEILERWILERRNRSYLKSFMRQLADIKLMARHSAHRREEFDRAHAKQMMLLQDLRAAEKIGKMSKERSQQLSMGSSCRSVSRHDSCLGRLKNGELHTPGTNDFVAATNFSPPPRKTEMRANGFLSSMAFDKDVLTPLQHSASAPFEKYGESMGGVARNALYNSLPGRSAIYTHIYSNGSGDDVHEKSRSVWTASPEWQNMAQTSTSAPFTISTGVPHDCRQFLHRADWLPPAPSLSPSPSPLPSVRPGVFVVSTACKSESQNARETSCGVAPVASRYKRWKRWA